MDKPVSVQGSDKTRVYKLNIGPKLARGPQQSSDFWEYLRNWRGEWMWEGIEDGQVTKSDHSWLVQGMKSNTLLWARLPITAVISGILSIPVTATLFLQ
jgi:hypothetical protein